MKYDDFGILAYVQSIRNRAKQDYAKAYAWHLKQGEVGDSPDRGKLSYMAAQAVRLRLEGFCLNDQPKE